MDGAFGPEGYGRLSAAGCVEGGNSGLWAVGCGIALRAMSFEISLREMENQTTGLRPLEMHPYPRLSAVLPPEGEVCSSLSFWSHSV